MFFYRTPLGALPGVSVQICSNESGIHELKMSENVSHGHCMRPNRSSFTFMHSYAVAESEPDAFFRFTPGKTSLFAVFAAESRSARFSGARNTGLW